jgi:hypothetical protein
MGYIKPELSRLGATMSVMRGLGKQISPVPESAIQHRLTVAAYEADE